MSDKQKFAVFLWTEGAPATWRFFATELEAVDEGRSAVQLGEFENAKIFEQRFIDSFQDRSKLSRRSPHEKGNESKEKAS